MKNWFYKRSAITKTILTNLIETVVSFAIAITFFATNAFMWMNSSPSDGAFLIIVASASFVGAGAAFLVLYTWWNGIKESYDRYTYENEKRDYEWKKN